MIFVALILVPAIASRRFGLNAVAAFWTAYILTRPLGASFADWMGSPARRGGLGLGMPLTTGLWASAIAVFVVCVAVAGRRPCGGSRAGTTPARGRDDAATST
jgi:uncharacterized membrane-anchored protein